MKFFMKKEILEETRRKDGIDRMFYVYILKQNFYVIFNYNKDVNSVSYPTKF